MVSRGWFVHLYQKVGGCLNTYYALTHTNTVTTRTQNDQASVSMTSRPVLANTNYMTIHLHLGTFKQADR